MLIALYTQHIAHPQVIAKDLNPQILFFELHRSIEGRCTRYYAPNRDKYSRAAECMTVHILHVQCTNLGSREGKL